MVRILEEICSELHDQADHMVEHLCLLVHVDGQIGLACGQVHLLSLLEVALCLKLLRFLHLNRAVLAFRQVVNDQLIGFLPLVCSYVHLKGLNILTSFDKEGLGLLVFADLGVVASNLDLIGPHLVGRLVLDKVHGAVPVAGLQGRLNCLVEHASLDEVVNGLVELPL